MPPFVFRSSDANPLSPVEADSDGKVIKGAELFGDDLPVWLAMMVEHKKEPIGTIKELVSMVANHWHRGIHMLWDDWQHQEENFDNFLMLLATRAGVTEGRSTRAGDQTEIQVIPDSSVTVKTRAKTKEGQDRLKHASIHRIKNLCF